jgi:hydroxymethylbilane synthase
MQLLCVPKREVADDWLITPKGIALDDLDAGAKVGTTSLRRICQLRAARPDLAYLPLRGNVNTRLRKLDEGEYDAIVLAGAGLRRLGMDDRPHWRIPTNICLPAVGQGTLALEGRADNEALRRALAPLEDPHSRVTMEAERSFLRAIEGNCHVPVAGHARYQPDEARLAVEAFVGSDDTEQTLHASAERYLTGSDTTTVIATAREMGREVAQQLIGRGASGLMREALSNIERKKHGGEGWTWN